MFPGLVGPDEMALWHMTLSFSGDGYKVSTFGREVRMVSSATKHWCISLLDYDYQPPEELRPSIVLGNYQAQRRGDASLSGVELQRRGRADLSDEALANRMLHTTLPTRRCRHRCDAGWSGPTHCENWCIRAYRHTGSHNCSRHGPRRPKIQPPQPPPQVLASVDEDRSAESADPGSQTWVAFSSPALCPELLSQQRCRGAVCLERG